MNRYMSRKIYIIINIVLFLIEIVMIYFVVESFLNNDSISPNEVTFYEYLLNKISNLV